MRDFLPFCIEDIRRWNETIPTPFYVYDEDGIRETVREVLEAFSWNEGFKEYFAVKATPTPAILRLLSSLGFGADCASVPEMILAHASGMEIMLSSNETRPEEYIAARNFGGIINLDDITQIENMENSVGIPDTVSLRLNPGEFSGTNDIIGHPKDAKFGMTKDQLFESVRILKEKGAKSIGLHSMVSSCTLDEDYYGMLSALLFGLMIEIRDLCGVAFDFVNLSGGIGIPYRPDEKRVDIAKVGEKVRKAYEKILAPEGLNPRIFTEMGRFVTGPHGYLVSKVVGLKNTYKKYIGLDSTAANLMRPAVYGAYHHIVVPGKENERKLLKQDVVGSLCENCDKFAIDRLLPEVSPGDYAVIEDCGAHGHSMGYNYNGALRSAEYLMNAEKELTLIRRAETEDDYFATLDCDPVFLEAAGDLKPQEGV